MSFKFFIVPIREGGTAEAQLNAFLASHKVLSVDRRWVEQGADSFWSFCVDHLAHGTPPGAESPRARPREPVDYKERLPPEQFAVFSRLRDLRKEIAQAEAVPMYTIFTNEQLAKLVTERVRTAPALEKVEGVGEARAKRYGPRFLELLGRLLGPEQEADGKAD
jgi:superfamily II DNA helicase RecQ